MPILRRTLRRIPNLHAYSETLPETSPAKLRQQKITNKKCFRHSQNSSTMRACPHDLGQLSLMAPKSLKLRCPRACRFTPYSLRGCRTTFQNAAFPSHPFLLPPVLGLHFPKSSSKTSPPVPSHVNLAMANAIC